MFLIYYFFKVEILQLRLFKGLEDYKNYYLQLLTNMI